MRRSVLMPAALLPAIVAAAWLLLAARADPPAGRSYTVAGILDAISRNPPAWDGRTVRVRGAIQPGLMLVRDSSRLPTTAPTAPAPGYLPLADSLSAMTVLWVNGRHDGGLTALLQRIPVARALLPRLRDPAPGAMRSYRVQLHIDPAECPSPICVTGTLLDYTAPAF